MSISCIDSMHKMQNDILIISKLHLSVTEYRYSVSVAMIGGKKSWNSLNEIIHNFYFMRCSIVDFFFLLARNVQMPPRTALATTNSNKLERKLFNENCVNHMYYINSGKCAHSTLLVDLFTSLPTVEMKWWHIDLSHFLHTANVCVCMCVYQVTMGQQSSIVITMHT